mgnify:CR=1 FL=1
MPPTRVPNYEIKIEIENGNDTHIHVQQQIKTSSKIVGIPATESGYIHQQGFEPVLGMLFSGSPYVSVL